MGLDEITAGMREKLGDGAGIDATVKFDFGSDGVIFLDGKSNPNTVTNEDKDADCTIAMSLDDFKSLVAGDLDPTMAFMMGKLKVSGNMGIAMKLSSVLG